MGGTEAQWRCPVKSLQKDFACLGHRPNKWKYTLCTSYVYKSRIYTTREYKGIVHFRCHPSHQPGFTMSEAKFLELDKLLLGIFR